MELKDNFPEVFSAGLGKCTKIKANFELKENTRPIFRKKRNLPFATTEKINQELLPKQNKLQKTTLVSKKGSTWEKKFTLKKYQNKTSCWERGIIKKRIDDMVYIVEGPKYTHKRHQDQLQKCFLNDSNNIPQTEEEPIDSIFDMFDLDPPQSTPEKHRSGRKRKFTNPLTINPKKKKNTNSPFTK